MHPLKSIGIIGLSPMFQCSACRFSSFLLRKDFRPQCIPFNPFLANSQGFLQSSDRLYSTSAFSSSPSQASLYQSFSYRIGAAFSAKNRRFDPSCDIFNFDPADTASNTRNTASGQDAFFASRIGNSENVVFGVADGVGGWAESGIDSAGFSNGLCKYMMNSAKNSKEPGDKFPARKLLHRGYAGVIADPGIPGGGSTACVAVARSDGIIEIANLGDSGFVQLRLNAIHCFSDPQTHAFNTPYQLSKLPPRMLAQARAFGETPLSDSPRDASVTLFQVRHGDVLIFATDGVWDNLSSFDILQLVNRKMAELNAWVLGERGVQVGETLSNLTLHAGNNSSERDTLQTALAITITTEAKSAGLNTKADGPFAREVHKHYPHENYHGGKADDVCVVVAIVVEGGQVESHSP